MVKNFVLLTIFLSLCGCAHDPTRRLPVGSEVTDQTCEAIPVIGGVTHCRTVKFVIKK